MSLAQVHAQDAKPRSHDPGRTSKLRKGFRAAADMQLNQLRAGLRQALVDFNVLGLSGGGSNYSMMSSGARLNQFAGWLENAANAALDARWWVHPWLDKATQHGLNSAKNELQGVEYQPIPTTFADLHELARHELRGIIGALVQKVVRQAHSAATRRLAPHQAFRELTKPLDGDIRNRLQLFAQHFGQKGHIHGKVEAYRQAGVRRIGVVPEMRRIRRNHDQRSSSGIRHSYTLHDAFDPDEPRNEHGEWSGGWSGAGEAYHGTLEKNLKTILKKGIVPRGAKPYTPHVFIAPDTGTAALFAGSKSGDATRVLLKIVVPKEFRNKFENYSFAKTTESALQGNVKIRPEWIKAWAPLKHGSWDIGEWQHLRDAFHDTEPADATWVTADDDLVCDECEEMASGSPYSLDEVMDLIPLHPNCRCTLTTYDGPEEEDFGDSVMDADVDFTKGEGGRFTGSIGHGGGKHSQPSLQHDPQLSQHYSVHAHLHNGVIFTTNVYDATRALYEGRDVRLKQPKQVATLVEHLANISKRMTEMGTKPPNFDLCHVTVRGTNLFCADTKGIPRIKMPQMGDDKETSAFKAYLVNKGYKVETGTELASHLRATQNQLVGAKVGGIARAMAAHPERMDRRLVISRDNYILDGHHTWAAELAVDAKNNRFGDKKMKIWRVDIDIISLLKEAEAFTGGKGHLGVGAEQQKDALWFNGGWAFSDAPVEFTQDPLTGRFTGSVGHGGDFGAIEVDSELTDVGGDEWNRQTASRLAIDYQRVKPELEDLATKVVKEGEFTASTEEPVTTWDQLSNDTQESTKSKYIDDNLQNEVDQEISNWHDNGDAVDDAKRQLIYDLDNKALSDLDWFTGAFDAVREQREENGESHIPYTNEQLWHAITIDSEPGYGYQTDNTHDKVIFDNAHLQDPDNLAPSGQQLEFPGIQAAARADQLSPDMRKQLEASIKEAFQTKAKDIEGEMESPDYLSDSANESLSEYFDQMEDSEKFSTAVGYDLVDAPADDAEVVKVEYPGEGAFDPLDKESSGNSINYKKTGALARAMSVARAADLLQQRDTKLDRHDAESIARDLDHTLWADWKSSSTSSNGLLIQKAISLEFNTHFRSPYASSGLDNEIKKAAGAFGGMEHVKAYLRAKWETSQYLLDHSGDNTVELYRTIDVGSDNGREETVVAPKSDNEYTSGKKFIRVPELAIKRNGAASTTTDINVANHWDGSGRVVLRFEVPRTSLIGLPCYGQNVYGEHEVVMLGGAIKKWDAWDERAPTIDVVPFGTPAAPPEKEQTIRGSYDYPDLANAEAKIKAALPVNGFTLTPEEENAVKMKYGSAATAWKKLHPLSNLPED